MRALLATLVLVLASLLLPTANAQAFYPSLTQVFVESSGSDLGRLSPEIETADVPIRVRVTMAPGTVCVGDLNVKLGIKQMPAYATVIVDPAVVTIPVDNLNAVRASEYDAYAIVHVTVSRDAPAMTEGMYTVHAFTSPSSSWSTCPVGPSEGRADFAVRNDYVPLLRAEPEPAQSFGSGGLVPILLTNLGNGPTRVVPELIPDHAGQFDVLSAPEARLESANYGGEDAAVSTTMPISYQLAPGVLAASFKVRLVSSYDGEAIPEAPSEELWLDLYVEDDGRVEGPQGEAMEHGGSSDVPTVPGPSLLLLLATALAGAVWRRRTGLA